MTARTENIMRNGPTTLKAITALAILLTIAVGFVVTTTFYVQRELTHLEDNKSQRATIDQLEQRFVDQRSDRLKRLSSIHLDEDQLALLIDSNAVLDQLVIERQLIADNAERNGISADISAPINNSALTPMLSKHSTVLSLSGSLSQILKTIADSRGNGIQIVDLTIQSPIVDNSPKIFTTTITLQRIGATPDPVGDSDA